MIKKTLFFVILLGLSFAYTGATINAVTLTTANTVYTLKAADTSRQFARINAVSGNLYVTIGNSGALTSLNYGIYIANGSFYEIGLDNLATEKISALCTQNAGKALILTGNKY